MPAALQAAGAWLRERRSLSRSPSAIGSCMAARNMIGRSWSTTTVLADLERYTSAGAAAPAEQPRADPRDAGRVSRSSAGCLFRYRVSSRSQRACRSLCASRSISTPRACAGTDFTACRMNISRAACREVAPEIARGRVIVAHLGSGASMCALVGRPQRRKHDGLHGARRVADGHTAGPDRSRRRALPHRRKRG